MLYSTSVFAVSHYSCRLHNEPIYAGVVLNPNPTTDEIIGACDKAMPDHVRKAHIENSGLTDPPKGKSTTKAIINDPFNHVPADCIEFHYDGRG